MKIFLLTTSLLLNLFAFCQCDEYYINELISGNDDKCYFEGGTKVRFCPNLHGMAIGEFTLDISQWDGISTQYITVTKNGDIAGTVVLKLNEKELLLNINGCGGSRTYSISLSKNKYEQWLNDKPSRDLAKQQQALRLQEQKMKFQQDSINIQRIKAENNLNSYFKILDSATINHMLEFSWLNSLCKISNVDTITIDYINGKTYVNFDYHNIDNYCARMGPLMDRLKQTDEYKNSDWREQDKMTRFYKNCCVLPPGTLEVRQNQGGGWPTEDYKLEDFFSQGPNLPDKYRHDITEINIDTLIDGYRIPLNVRLQIVLSKKICYSINSIYAPLKFKDSQLFYSNDDFQNKLVSFGSYSSTITEGLYPLPEDVKIQFFKMKLLWIEKKKYNLLYANNILLDKQFDSIIKELYNFKKVK